ncbi:MAG: hypothetical protein U9R56_05735, partial [candidate division Zixibacteria bacterium]|nr:hypothetical protein [candidate division Zixibacteria bacterium]
MLLYLNNRLLRRGVDYTFDKVTGAFDLSQLKVIDSDTLSVTYRKLPDWLLPSYGRSLPDAVPTNRQNLEPLPLNSGRARVTPTGVSFSGAKSFRFSARSSGASDFSQSLDLNISGPLTPGLDISGAISDRGYDPSYGTVNSRLNELDKINLRLTSQRLNAQIGDISVVNSLATDTGPGKQVSGVSVVVHDPGWQMDALAARPKGRFATARFYGYDGRQGPYQIGGGTGIDPVVPGSEIVWLDGRKLERGANKDYLIDYPAGRVTFNVNHLIDSRSRIEIDYEPQTTDYKGELLAGGGGVSVGDSGFFLAVRWLREGDDQNQPLLADLSDADKTLLSGVGDNIMDAVRTGVREDSIGAYDLVSESLPDTVFSFVGVGNGDYSITFSYFGEQKGDYRFLGSGNYEHVGVGNGDYMPQVVVPAPERAEYACIRAGLQNDILGDLITEFRQSRFDQNLLSGLDDSDNDGRYYSFESKKNWRWGNQGNRVTFGTHWIDAEYQKRTRLHSPDFGRNYLLPEDFIVSTDESFAEVTTLLSPMRLLSVQSDLSRLVYRDRFSSLVGGTKASFSPAGWLDGSVAWRTVRSHLDSTTTGRNGEGDNYLAQLRYKLSKHFRVTSLYEHDKRRNDYSGISNGARYDRYRLELERQDERLRFEHYAEDTLDGNWKDDLKRNRLSLASNRSMGIFSYNLNLTQQWLKRLLANEKSFLGRFGYQYHSTHRRLTLGGAYMISTETRNERGLSYIEVEPGQGDYIFDNGQYVPDPDGDYLRMEEILSNRSRVRRGEKSFHFSKDWRTVLVRFNSHIEEELLDSGERGIIWLLPFVSNRNQPYLFYARRYDVDLRLFPVRGFHVVNIGFNEDIRSRDVAGVTRCDLRRT